MIQRDQWTWRHRLIWQLIRPIVWYRERRR